MVGHEDIRDWFSVPVNHHLRIFRCFRKSCVHRRQRFAVQVVRNSKWWIGNRARTLFNVRGEGRVVRVGMADKGEVVVVGEGEEETCGGGGAWRKKWTG